MVYKLINNQELFIHYYDQILVIIQKAFRKHKRQQSSSPLILLKQITLFVTNPCGFVLALVDDEDNIKGLLVALAVPDPDKPWAEIVILWTAPGVAKLVKREAWDIFKKYMFTRYSISTVYACVFRSPDKFFKWFYEPLGFKKVGLVVEATF